MKKGFDSWGATDFPQADEYLFAYFNFNNFTAPYTKHKYFDQQWRVAGDKGYLRGPYSMWRYYCDQTNNARWVIDGLPILELPLALDFEDKYAVKGIRTVEKIAQYGKTFTDHGIDIVNYTATWWWNTWVKPYDSYFAQFGWSPYDYPLWECDPPPDTVTPGRWTPDQIVMVQSRLDYAECGFNAKIDEDQATDVFYQKYKGGASSMLHKVTLDVPREADTIEITLKRG